MFLRGGLLIEPWKPYKSYTNDPRIQDVVLYDNTIYVCSVSHISGATFSENANKFISAGSGGTGGSSGGTGGGYAGEWDLNTSVVVTPPVVSDLSFDEFLSSAANNINNTSITNITPNTLIPNLPSAAVYAGRVSNVLNNFSDTRWIQLEIPSLSYVILYFTDDSVEITNIPDMFYTDLFLNGTNPIDYMMILLGSEDGNILGEQVKIVNDGVFTSPMSTNSGSPINDTFTIKFGINKLLNQIIIEKENNIINTYTLPIPIIDFTRIFMSGILFPGGGFVGGTMTLQSHTDTNRNPLQNVSGGNIIIPPNEAKDGEIWRVLNNGTYNSTYDLLNNDIILFYNNTQDLVKLVDQDTKFTTSQINGLINSAIETSTTNGVIHTAINDAISNLPPVGTVDYISITYTNTYGGINFYNSDDDILYNEIIFNVTDGVERIVPCYFNTHFNNPTYEDKGIFRLTVVTNAPVTFNIYSESGSLIKTIGIIDMTTIYFTDVGSGIKIITIENNENFIISQNGIIQRHDPSLFNLSYTKGILEAVPFTNICAYSSNGLQIDNTTTDTYFPNSKAALAYRQICDVKYTTGFDMIIPIVDTAETRGVLFSTSILSNTTHEVLLKLFAGNSTGFFIKIETGGLQTSADRDQVRIFVNDSTSSHSIRSLVITLPTHIGSNDRRLRFTIDVKKQYVVIKDLDTLYETKVLFFYFHTFDTIFVGNRTTICMYNTINTIAQSSFTNNMNIIESFSNGKLAQPFMVELQMPSSLTTRLRKIGKQQFFGPSSYLYINNPAYQSLLLRDEEQWLEFGSFMYGQDNKILYNEKFVPTETQTHTYTTSSLKTLVQILPTTKVLELEILDNSISNFNVLLPYLLSTERYIQIVIIGSSANIVFSISSPNNAISTHLDTTNMNTLYSPGVYNFKGMFDMGVVTWKRV